MQRLAGGEVLMTADEVFNLHRNMRGYEDFEKRRIFGSETDAADKFAYLEVDGVLVYVTKADFLIIEKRLLSDTYAFLEKSILA
jgi:hypothetical protein